MKTKGLNFIEAVQAAKKGHYVQRVAWGDSERSIYVIAEFDDLQYINSCGSGTFTPSIQDILANDWFLIMPAMTFKEAIKHLRKYGDVVRRKDHTVHMCFGGIGQLRFFRIHDARRVETDFFAEHFEANDWIVAEI